MLSLLHHHPLSQVGLTLPEAGGDSATRAAGLECAVALGALLRDVWLLGGGMPGSLTSAGVVPSAPSAPSGQPEGAAVGALLCAAMLPLVMKHVAPHVPLSPGSSSSPAEDSMRRRLNTVGIPLLSSPLCCRHHWVATPPACQSATNYLLRAPRPTLDRLSQPRRPLSPATLHRVPPRPLPPVPCPLRYVPSLPLRSLCRYCATSSLTCSPPSSPQTQPCRR